MEERRYGEIMVESRIFNVLCVLIKIWESRVTDLLERNTISKHSEEEITGCWGI